MSSKTCISLCMVALLVLLVSVAWGAIGVYPRSNPGLCPANISYVLNKDADMLAGEVPDWSLKIEIVPAAGGAAVRTWRFLPTDEAAKKGIHNNVVTWDGMKDDGSPAPSGYYYAKITARATPVPNDNNLHLTWIDARAEGVPANRWCYMPGVNRNINSPLYGRIYVSQGPNGTNGQGLKIYEPDGTVLGTTNCGLSWGGGSAVYTADVDQSDNIWVSARSGTHARTVWCIKSDLSGPLCGPISFPNYDRGGGIYGPTNDIKVLISACLTTGTMNGQLFWGTGDGTLGGSAFTMQGSWTIPDSTYEPDMLAFQPAKLFLDTSVTPARVRALVPYRFKNANTTGTGGICLYDIDWTGTAVPSKVWRNDSLPGSISVDIAPDGETLWVTRNVVTDGQEVGKISMTNAAAGLGFDQLYGLAGDGVQSQLIYMKIDGFGNILATGGGWTEAFEYSFGMYEPPESGPVSVATINVPSPDGAGILWEGDASPVFVSGSFSVDPVCVGQTTRLTVTVSDASNDCATGKNDIASVVVNCPVLGWTNAAMTYQSCSGKERTYYIDGTVQAGTPAGAATVAVTINDVHAEAVPGTGNVSFVVKGGFITGVITNGETNEPASGVTVKATLGTAEFTAVTDAQGRYTINVEPGTGYAVTPVTAGPYGTTTPTEYNLQPDWPNAGTGDWPKTADVAACGTTADLNGRVWPLAATQVFYNWSTSAFLPSDRDVSVIGTVMRQPAIPSIQQQGFNGYYYITDSRYQSTQIGCKIAYRDGDPPVKKGDKVVVTGRYQVPYMCAAGSVTPASSASVVIFSSDNLLPTPRDMSYYRNNGSGDCAGSVIYASLLGRLYRIPGAKVTAVDTANQRYTVQIPRCVTDLTLENVTIDLNTSESTGCPMPAVGDILIITGVLEQYDVWDAADANKRAIRPGDSGDQILDAGAKCSEIYSLADDTDVYLKLKRVTAVGASDGSNGIPADWVYVEDADRSGACAVYKTGIVEAAKLGLGDQLTAFGKVKSLPNGWKYVEATNVTPQTATSIFPRPLDALLMTSRAANENLARAKFVKLVGKVRDPAGDESFILDDGGVPVKVYCGAIPKPATGATVKVRGVISSDGTNATLLVRSEFDIADANATQSLPMPGYYNYFRDYLIAGPFTDPNAGGTTNQERHDALMAIDFIDRANGGTGAVTEGSVQPRIGDPVGPNAPGMQWRRYDGYNDLIDFNRVFLPGGGYQEFSVVYAVAYIWAPTDMYVDLSIGSDDGVTIYVNGSQVYQDLTLQGTVYSKSACFISLTPGLNTIVYKVVNAGSGFGLVSNIIYPGSLITPGWGNGFPVMGLSYYSDRP